jgi:hypothetical protein
MSSRLFCAALFCVSTLVYTPVVFGSADKTLPIDETSNEMLDISVSAPLDKDQIKQELGSDLGDGIVVIRLTARTVSDKPVQLSLDDFLLVSSKDGQRSEPYAPGQLAGSDSLAVTQNGMRKSGLGDHRPRPSLGIGGLGGIGTGGTSAPPPDTKMEESRADKDNPLLAALNAKVLPEKEITEPTSGLLIFQIVGKVKPKDLELHYKGPAGKMALRWPEK